MYAEDTQFLTRRGWRKASQMRKIDEVANYGAKGKIEWVHMQHANIQESNRAVSVYDSKVGRTGKFAVTLDHDIRFFHNSRGKEITIKMSLQEVIERLEVQNSITGSIPTTFKSGTKSGTQEGNTAIILSKMFTNIYRIDEKGRIHFAISRKLSKQQILNFLLKEVDIPHKHISLNTTNTAVMVSGWSLIDWYESIIDMPHLLTKVIDTMLFKEDKRANTVRKLRFFCPVMANLAQIAVAFTGRNSRVMLSEVYRKKNHLVVVEPKESSVSFRNKVIIVPKMSKVVTTCIEHPITRWQGSIISL